MKNFKKFRNSMKKLVSSLLYESPSGNQVDGLPLALSRDAVSACWIRFGRAPDYKIYKKMYTFDRISDR